ncbi:MAG: hypothetical protein HXY40_16935 [Chloroflexi bacterium]|nr:hypothetical protein [Chloroflexota bacterium]
MNSVSRNRLLLACALLVLLLAALWSMPLQAQDGNFFLQQATYRPTLTPVPPPVSLVLTINTSSCVLSVVAPPSDAPARPTYRPTLTPVPPPPDPNAPVPFFLGNAPTYTVGEGCEAVVERLQIPQNDVRWFSITVEGDDVTLLPLQPVPNDPFPPQLDTRGRYFACGIPETGQQACQVAVLVGEQAYIVSIPINVEEAYFGPVFGEATATPAP